MEELKKPNIDETFDGLENDIIYDITGNESDGVKTIKLPMSANDKSYDQGGFGVQHPTTGTMQTIPENALIFTKKAILEQINAL